jgi:heat shock protein HtpX
MAANSVGLKTHIWNNNIRSLLFLLLYPIVITATYMSLLAVIFMSLAYSFRDSVKSIDFLSIFLAIVLEYWYIPYGLVFTFLLLVFVYNYDRVNKSFDMNLVTRINNSNLYSLLENLCISRGLSMPHFFIKTHDSCNAYTSGLTTDSYQIVVTSGLLEKLNQEEIKAVLGHELTHLINGDTRLVFLMGTVTHMFQTLAGLFSPKKADGFEVLSHFNNIGITICWFLLWCVLKLANIGVLFAQLFISRKREYIADAGAIELTKNPHALISALTKIDQNTTEFRNSEVVKLSLINYNKVGLISTHPSIQDRIVAISFFSRIEEPLLSPWGRNSL